MEESHPPRQPDHTPPPSVTIQWMHCRIGGSWQDIDPPHPNSPLAAALGNRPPGDTFADGMGNLYRRVEVR
jgi:hypothetical protein